MADYRIICTCQEPISAPTTHAHIVSVGTGTSTAHYDSMWTVTDVYLAIDRGSRFFTYGESSGKWALVEKFSCCGRRTLRSAPDAVWDNNLDALPRCQT